MFRKFWLNTSIRCLIHYVIIICISGLRKNRETHYFVCIYLVINFSSTNSKFVTLRKVIRILHWMLCAFYKLLLYRCLHRLRRQRARTRFCWLNTYSSVYRVHYPIQLFNVLIDVTLCIINCTPCIFSAIHNRAGCRIRWVHNNVLSENIVKSVTRQTTKKFNARYTNSIVNSSFSM